MNLKVNTVRASLTPSPAARGTVYRRSACLSPKAPRKRNFLIAVSKASADAVSALSVHGGTELGSGGFGGRGGSSVRNGHGGTGNGGCRDGSSVGPAMLLMAAGLVELCLEGVRASAAHAQQVGMPGKGVDDHSFAWTGGALIVANFMSAEAAYAAGANTPPGSVEKRENFWTPELNGTVGVTPDELPYLAAKQFHVRELVYIQ